MLRSGLVRLALLSLASLLVSPAFVLADDWGTISGQVILDDEVPAVKYFHRKGADVKDKEVCAKDDVVDDRLVIDSASKGIANVFVYLKDEKVKVHPDLKASKEPTVTFDQKDGIFFPHALVVRTDQKVKVLSDDPIGHNTHTNPLKNNPVNFLVSPNDRKGVEVPVTQSEKLPFKVVCDIHPWMSAYWLVVPHPYAAVTDKDGKFTIENLPTGEHVFRVWQEKAGYLEKELKVTVKAGPNELKPIKAKLKAFEK